MHETGQQAEDCPTFRDLWDLDFHDLDFVATAVLALPVRPMGWLRLLDGRRKAGVIGRVNGT